MCGWLPVVSFKLVCLRRQSNDWNSPPWYQTQGIDSAHSFSFLAESSSSGTLYENVLIIRLLGSIDHLAHNLGTMLHFPTWKSESFCLYCSTHLLDINSRWALYSIRGSMFVWQGMVCNMLPSSDLRRSCMILIRCPITLFSQARNEAGCVPTDPIGARSKQIAWVSQSP